MLTELSALLDLLKAKGVTHYEGPVWDARKQESFFQAKIELLPASMPAPADDKPDAKTPDPDVCACGHGIHEHQNGLCLHGCDEEKCGAR